MKKIILIIIIMISGSAIGDECASWGCNSTITDLYTNANGLIYVGTNGDETTANCSAVTNVYFSLNPKSENVKEVYASLLAAYMSNKKILIRIIDNHSMCEIAYVKLSAE